jgi:hypothetical protein
MVDQFTRLRDGDRFFYLNESWNSSELNIFQQGNTLAKIIEANTNITNLQSDVFYFKASISGTVFAAASRSNCQSNGAAGIIVELEDTDGDILATTSTDSHGKYSFNQLSGYSGKTEVSEGLAVTGKFKIVLVLPGGVTQTSKTIVVSRGDTNTTGVNFTVAAAASKPGHPPGCDSGKQKSPVSCIDEVKNCHGPTVNKSRFQLKDFARSGKNFLHRLCSPLTAKPPEADLHASSAKGRL